jgi:hypothetical protein
MDVFSSNSRAASVCILLSASSIMRFGTSSTLVSQEMLSTIDCLIMQLVEQYTGEQQQRFQLAIKKFT